MAHVCASGSRSCSMAAVAFTVTLVPSSPSGQQPGAGMRSLGDPRPPAASDAGLRAGWSGAWPGLLPLALSTPPQSPIPRMQFASENQALSGTAGRVGAGQAGIGPAVGTTVAPTL